MRQTFRLALLFFVAVAIGCAPVARDVPRQGAAMSADEAVGVWTLSDDENAAFDVRLTASGSAVSNWSKGKVGARGERGRWEIVDGALVIDYDDGWRDMVIKNEQGALRKQSYAPGMPRNGPARTESGAVRLSAEFSEWVGVYEVAAEGPRTGAAHFVAIQSTGLAWNTADDARIGSWWIAGDALRVRWANGWLDEFRVAKRGFVVRSWAPATAFDATGNPSQPAAHAADASRCE